MPTALINFLVHLLNHINTYLVSALVLGVAIYYGRNLPPVLPPPPPPPLQRKLFGIF